MPRQTCQPSPKQLSLHPLPEQPEHFPRFGVPSGGQLAVDQPAVHADFEAATVGGDQPDRFDVGFEFLEQFGRQTDGPVGVVSDRAVDDFDFDHGRLL